METLLLVPLDDAIVFPGMTVTLALDVGEEDRVLLVPRKDGEFASVGTIAQVVEQVPIPGGGKRRRPPGPASRDPRGGPDRRRRRAARRGRRPRSTPSLATSVSGRCSASTGP